MIRKKQDSCNRATTRTMRESHLSSSDVDATLPLRGSHREIRVLFVTLLVWSRSDIVTHIADILFFFRVLHSLHVTVIGYRKAQ